MKVSNLLLSMFGLAILSACSENDVPTENGWEDSKNGHFMAVEIISPSSNSTRSLTSPGDGQFEEGLGTPDENKVNSLRFYFFDALGNPISVATTGYNFINVTPIPDKDNTNMPNVEQKLKAVVVVKPEHKANVVSMLAIANYEKAGLENKSYNRTELASIAGDYSSVQKDDGTANFMMTSSTYANATGQVTRATIDPAKHLCTTEAEALNNPLSIYIERVVAKVRVKTDWRTTTTSTDQVVMEKMENISYNGKSYTGIKAKDQSGNVIQNNGKDIYILFTGWDITGKADKSYLIKKVNSTSAWTDLSGKWFWNHPDYCRSYWAVNPDNVVLQYDSHTSISKEMETGNAYCLENAAEGTDKFKLGTVASYDPEKERSNRTQVILAATLVTIDGTKATPISLAKWGNQEFTEDGAKTAMFNLVNQRIYVKENQGENIRYRTIDLAEVELVTGKEAGKADYNSENSERYLSYLKLTKTAEELEFYGDNTGTTSLTIDQVNTILSTMPGAEIWHDGLTYYYTTIRHLGQDLNNVGYGYYGVVRNHIYDIKLQSVTGLGTPVLKPDEKIIPQKPKDNQDIYVAAQVNILSWRIVNNNTELEW